MADAQIPVRWRPALGVLWLATAALLTLLMALGLPARLAELRVVCDGATCPSLALTSGELALLQARGIGTAVYAAFLLALDLLVALMFAALALLLFWRKRADWVGLAVSYAFLYIGTVFYSEIPRALARAVPALAPLNAVLTAIGIVGFILIFYIFPDGRFAPRALRWLFALCVAVLVLEPLLLPHAPQAASTSVAGVVAATLGALGGFASLIYRYRYVANVTQRQQMKWVLAGFSGLLFASLSWILFAELFPLPAGPARLLFVASILPQYLLLSFFPLSLAIAMLRHGLWEIDLIIRRTLQYSLVSGTLALIYFGSVVLLQALLGSLLGARSPVVIVLSTLLIAALFRPLRQRVQDAIDRRYYRRRYDPAAVLAQFAQVCRDEAELEALAAALVTVIDETLQPTHISIWLRPY